MHVMVGEISLLTVGNKNAQTTGLSTDWKLDPVRTTERGIPWGPRCKPTSTDMVNICIECADKSADCSKGLARRAQTNFLIIVKRQNTSRQSYSVQQSVILN